MVPWSNNFYFKEDQKTWHIYAFILKTNLLLQSHCLFILSGAQLEATGEGPPHLFPSRSIRGSSSLFRPCKKNVQKDGSNAGHLAIARQSSLNFTKRETVMVFISGCAKIFAPYNQKNQSTVLPREERQPNFTNAWNSEARLRYCNFVSLWGK